MSQQLKAEIEQQAKVLGFDICKFTSAHLPDQTSENLAKFIELERHGDMAWMETTLDRRKQPTAMWAEAKSAIILGLNYGPEISPLKILEQKTKAAISVYAQNRDYHDIIKGRLKQIAQKVASQNGCDVKVFVDTAPLLEKPLAEQSGLGWQGKHTNLVSKQLGSWLFLGVILTDLEIEPDQPEADHCGSCTACLDICPTNAFPAPYQLDARKCISYLTIEFSGSIPKEFRNAMGNRIYGCDDCLAVCPWNKFAEASSEMKLKARDELKAPDISTLLELDDVKFRSFFPGSPVKRIGRNQFIRNVLIAAGNSGDDTLTSNVEVLLKDEDEVVRSTAVWALFQLMNDSAFKKIKEHYIKNEKSSLVRTEWSSNG